jgi:hypothetical protein
MVFTHGVKPDILHHDLRKNDKKERLGDHAYIDASSDLRTLLIDKTLNAETLG